MSGAPAQVADVPPVEEVKSFDDPEWVKERIMTLSTFLDNGVFDLAQILAVRDMCNASMAQGVATHPMWIPNKNLSALAALDAASAKAHKTEMCVRIAKKLALLPFLDYDHVTDENSLSVLMLSMVQAGFVPSNVLEEIYDFFDKRAPHPMMSRADLPASGFERTGRPSGVTLHVLPKQWKRVGPYAQELEMLGSSKVSGVAQAFKNLSESEQRRLLEEVGVPVAIASEGPLPLQPSLPDPVMGAFPKDFGQQLALGFAPLLTRLQDSVAAMVSSAKKRSKDSDDDDSEDEDEGRLEK
jgi:hypothetical protein